MTCTTYEIYTFQSGEMKISLNLVNNIISCKLYKDLNKSFTALLIAITKLREIYSEITAIIPFLPYSRLEIQSIINILYSLGVSKLITVEIHTESIKSEIEIYNISIIPEVVKIIGIDCKQLVIISPDEGGYKRAINAATILNCSFGSMEKVRKNGIINHTLNNTQSVRNRSVLIVDDIIDSGATINSAAEVLYNHGAKSIKALCIHGILSKKRFSPLIDKIYITNTIEQDSIISQLEIIYVDNIIKSKISEIINPLKYL